MAKYFSCAETAKLVRRELKSNFPGVKFSVRSSVYAGGASIDVEWLDGPSRTSVEKVVKQFQGAIFDGMTDSTTYVKSEWEGEEVRFGSDYVNCTRNMSRAFVEAVVQKFLLCNKYVKCEDIHIRGNEQNAWVQAYTLGYHDERELNSLLHNTDAKEMHRSYEAREERERKAEERKEREAQAQARRQRAEQEAQAKAQAEREAKERAEAEAKAEFERWEREQLYNKEWQLQQFKKWQQERELKAREEARRQEEQRQAEEKARREHEKAEQAKRQQEQEKQHQRENLKVSQRSILASKQAALAYLGLPLAANRSSIVDAFRKKVKAAADGKGGYTCDMDFLVRVKEKALG